MANFIFLFSRVVRLWFSSLFWVKKQKQFVHGYLDLDENSGAFDTAEMERIKTYAVMIPAFMGEAFSLLRLKPMSEKERLVLTCLGALTAMFDDLFDEKKLSDSYVIDLLQNAAQHQPVNAGEELMIRLYQISQENSVHKDKMAVYVNEVCSAQIESREQENKEIDSERLRNIIYRKGGVSIPVYRCAFDNDISMAEYDLLYWLGALGQLENDIFDVYKDEQNGIETLVTRTNHISELKNEYESLVSKVLALLGKTTFERKGKAKFRWFVLLITARGMVALDHLQKAEKETGGIFKPGLNTKKELICDMESPRNILKLIRYAAMYGGK